MERITLETKQLKKVYVDSANNKIEALKELTVSFERGKMYAIFGPSGSGKSTLLNLLGLLDKPSFGTVLIEGHDTVYKTPDEMADLRRDYIGFVFQDHYLNQKLTVEQNLELPMRINKKIKKSEYKKRCQDILSMFGMEEFINRYPNELSGGEQQRVCIARALINDPTVILADEPTGNLDEENERIVVEYLRGLTEQDKTVIVVTHNMVIREYADIVFEMRNGILAEV